MACLKDKVYNKGIFMLTEKIVKYLNSSIKFYFLKKVGTLVSICAIGLPGLCIAESKGSLEEGRKKVSMCVGCHGIPNYKKAFPKTYRVPMIAGQSSQYIVSALKAYKAGERSHPSMQAVAGSMSEKDMKDVALYYSSLR